MQLNKKQFTIVVIVLATLLGMFYYFQPRSSSIKSTKFAVSRWVTSGMTDEQAAQKALEADLFCNCIGFEQEDKVTSYSTSYKCYGAVFNCHKLK